MVCRRGWLQGALAISGLSLLDSCYARTEDDDDDTCYAPEPVDVKLTPGDWLRGARVAGLAAFADSTTCSVGADLSRMADERVTVVEVDCDLEGYLDEAAFAERLGVLDLVARECHTRGMRCVAYYPVLRSLSEDPEYLGHTMAKEHPDWVQIGIDGKPNVSMDGAGRVISVATGEESAWLCPTSGYVDYFNQRVARLAGTALDGVWGDVPLLSDLSGVWPCTNASCNAKLKADTGLDAPREEDWFDPGFVRWVAWRHRLLHDLEQRIVASAKAARRDFELIIQTVTADCAAATVQGHDGAHADGAHVHRAWEIDAVSDATAMRGASADDWLSMAAMMKLARGSSEPRPAWALCYGLEEDDAELTMGLAIAMGCSPYETKVPELHGSVGTGYRKRMFEWLERQPQLLLSRAASTTAVVYSSTSRDALDRARGAALYTSTNPGDQEWWSARPEDSAKETTYGADFRGCCELLFRQHVPFEVITTPHVTAEGLARCQVVIAPSLAALAEDAGAALVGWVERGGTLVLTGGEAGVMDERAVLRMEPQLLRSLELPLQSGPDGWTDKRVGAGRVLHAAGRLGRSVFRGEAATRLEVIAGALPRQVEADAPANVIVELRTADSGELVVMFANLDGLGSDGIGIFAPRPASFSCAVEIGGRAVVRVTLTAPASAGGERPPFTVEGTRIRFPVSVRAVAAAVVTFA